MARGLQTTVPPCRGEPDLFFADAPADREQAAMACTTCPLLEPCLAYSRAANERHGIWAGVDRATQPPTDNHREDTTA